MKSRYLNGEILMLRWLLETLSGCRKIWTDKREYAPGSLYSGNQWRIQKFAMGDGWDVGSGEGAMPPPRKIF